MITLLRTGLLVGFMIVVLGGSSGLSAQQTGRRTQFDESVPRMLEDLRSESRGRQSLRISTLMISITEGPQEWPRPRLDSLSQGLVEIIVSEQAGMDGLYSSMITLLTLETSGTGHVGTFDQLASIFEAELRYLPKPPLLEDMGSLAHEPRVVEFLAGIALGPEGRYSGLERIHALRGLARTEPGRGRLRALYNENAVSNLEAARYLRELAGRGFRPDSGGGVPE